MHPEDGIDGFTHCLHTLSGTRLNEISRFVNQARSISRLFVSQWGFENTTCHSSAPDALVVQPVPPLSPFFLSDLGAPPCTCWTVAGSLNKICRAYEHMLFPRFNTPLGTRLAREGSVDELTLAGLETRYVRVLNCKVRACSHA